MGRTHSAHHTNNMFVHRHSFLCVCLRVHPCTCPAAVDLSTLHLLWPPLASQELICMFMLPCSTSTLDREPLQLVALCLVHQARWPSCLFVLLLVLQVIDSRSTWTGWIWHLGMFERGMERQRFRVRESDRKQAQRRR